MKNVFAYILLFVPVLLVGQNYNSDFNNSDSNLIKKDKRSALNEAEIKAHLAEKKMKFRMEAGAFAGTSFGSGEFFGTYISPQLNYRLNPKFTLSTGMTITRTFGSPHFYSSADGVYGYPSSNLTQTFLYASGAYQLNKRLVLSGTVYKEINLLDQQSSITNKNTADYHVMIMGVDYKIGNNVFIQGQIEISNNPYSRHSYPNSYFGNGYRNNIFDHYPPF